MVRIILASSLLFLSSIHLFAGESSLLVPIAPAKVVSAKLAAAALFVDPKGSNDHDGRTEAKPVKTVQYAANLAQPGDTVYLRAGIYRESVRPRRSGEAGKPITYTSYPGERAQINGADLLEQTWAKGEGVIYSTTVHGRYQSIQNFSNQVFVDGQMMNLARWPNTSLDVSKPIKSAITGLVSKKRDEPTQLTTGVVEDTELGKADINVVGAEINFQPNVDAWSWAFSGKVTAQEKGTITFISPNNSGKDGGGDYPIGSRYFLYNSLALLDAEGEWYLNESTQKLFLITPSKGDPAKHKVEIKRRDWAFDLDERSFITISDVDLFACSITTDRAAGGDGIGVRGNGSTRYPWRGRIDGVAGASDILLTGLKAEYLTHFTDISGHFIQQWGQGSGIILSGSRLKIQDSVLRYSAGNGVTVLGSKNVVINNLIVDVNYSAVDCAGISTGGAAVTEDHELAYNTIARCGRSGITPRGLTNSDGTKQVSRIHHNDLFHCMLQDWDGGGLYTAVDDGKFVRVDHNLAHDIDGFNTSGLYVDYTKNYIFDHNLIWNTEWGFQFQGYFHPNAESKEKKEVNNTLAYHNTIHVKSTSGAPYGPFGFAGSQGKNLGTTIKNNIISINKKSPGWNAFASAYESADTKGNLIWDGSESDKKNNPLFTNLIENDFTLGSDSPAKGKAAALSTVTLDGHSVAPFAVDTLNNPDMGAFPYGVKPWQAGCNLAERTKLAPWGPAQTYGKLR